MPSDDKFERLILQLIRHTTKGEIEWYSLKPPPALAYGTDDVINEYFEAAYKGETIAVFERKYRSYDPEHDAQFWTSRDCLAFLYGDRSIKWETAQPQHRISALLNAARESAADVDGIIDSLLD